jgi:hypothetical protein
VDDQEKALRGWAEVLSFSKKGEFSAPPTELTGSTMARLNDTCGNWIPIARRL